MGKLRMRRYVAAGALAVLALLGTACGSGEGDEGTDVEASEAES